MNSLLRPVCFMLTLGLLFTRLANAQTIPALVNYQGRLANPDGTALATGDYQLTFRVHDSTTNSGGLVWGPQVFDGVAGQGHGAKIPVVQGYFNVMLGPVDTNGISLANAFNGTNRFVEITISNRPPILPRQQILTAPFAFQAANSAKLAGYDWSALFGTNDPVSSKIPGTKLANGAVTATQIGTNQVWLGGGNAGTSPGANFLGTTDNQPLEIKVNGQRALRLEPNGNVIGGSSANTIQTNSTQSTIAGGHANLIQSGISTIGGGFDNIIQNDSAFSTIGGGGHNSLGTNAPNSTIGGGTFNVVETNASNVTISGGAQNRVKADSYNTTVAGGANNSIQTNASGGSIGGGTYNLVQSSAFDAVIAGGLGNTIQTGSYRSVIAGGYSNTIQTASGNSVIGGGVLNVVQASAGSATIAGGTANSTAGVYATIPGGQSNTAAGGYSFAAGRRAKANHSGAFVWADSTDADFASTAQNQFLIRASNVGIGTTNPLAKLDVSGNFRVSSDANSALFPTNAAFRISRADDSNKYVYMGYDSNNFAFIQPIHQTVEYRPLVLNPSGANVGIGTISPQTKLDVNGTVTATAFSGNGAAVTSLNANNLTGTVADGRLSANVELLNGNQTVTGARAFSGGVTMNAATINDATINNNLSVDGTTLITDNINNRVGIGAVPLTTLQVHGAEVHSSGSLAGFSFNDRSLESGALFNPSPTAGHRWEWYSSGGIARLWSGSDKLVVDSAGNATATSFNPPSDRNLKENFTPVTSRDVLDKVASIPISRWNFKGDATTPHLGPMAQDFHAAFGLGTDDRHIATVDADGVALAAIQGLNQKLEEKLKEKDEEIELLKERLNRLEKESEGH